MGHSVGERPGVADQVIRPPDESSAFRPSEGARLRVGLHLWVAKHKLTQALLRQQH